MNNFPTVEHTTHESRDLPGLGKVKFRPFVLKEHRLLLETIQLQDAGAVVDMIGQMIDKATFGKINADTVEFHILEALYLDIYMKSKGSVFPAVYTCHNIVQKVKPLPPDVPLDSDIEREYYQGECLSDINVMVPLDRAKLVYPEAYAETLVVETGPNSGVKFKQPNLKDYRRFRQGEGAPKEGEEKMSLHDELIFASVACIYDGDRIMTPGVDFTADGLLDWMESWSGEQFEKVVGFFEDVPALTMEMDIMCPKCFHRSKVTLTGLDDFFA